MEANVRQELDALEEMVLNWKANYLEFATPDGGNDFLLEEFQHEITTYISPYLRRLCQCEYLSAEEEAEFLTYCYNQVDDLRQSIKKLETPPPKQGVWYRLITKLVYQE